MFVREAGRFAATASAAGRQFLTRRQPTTTTTPATTRTTRAMSMLNRVVTATANLPHEDQTADLNHCITQVRSHDPSGYLPGLLLPTSTMQVAYYAVRSFWVESGLRFRTTTSLPPTATPCEQLLWWKAGIASVFDDNDDFSDHPTLRLIRTLKRQQTTTAAAQWDQASFETILYGRRKDLDVKQYETLNDLVQHATESCGQLARLVLLQSGSVAPESHPSAYEATRLVGICHGLTNALRTSIPVMSLTGKLVVPAELTRKYGVSSPRYMLSALGQGHDPKCVHAFENAIRDIATHARDHLEQARSLKDSILQEAQDENDVQKAISVLLPGLASETFLDRLEKSNYQLTDRNLRSVGNLEHAACAWRMVNAYYNQRY